MLAAQLLRRMAPAAPIPCSEHSRREADAWVLAAGDYGLEVVEGTRVGALVVAASVTSVPQTRWNCPSCGARWCKVGEHMGTFHKCGRCDAGLWLRAPG